jgi:hypothetical protein
MKPRILLAEVAVKKTLPSTRTCSLSITFLALALGVPARPQEPPPRADSIAEAARNVREHKSNSTKNPKIITNDDLGVQSPVPSSPASPESPSPSKAEAPPAQAGCDNPDAEGLKKDLLVTQDERDQIRRELSDHSKVISGGDVDLTNLKPGYSGVNVGGPPQIQTEPLAPARVKEVILDEKIASLKQALRIACASPEAAGIHRKLDLAEQKLQLLRGEFSLDQATYYSTPNYTEHTADKAKLDAERQEIQSLETEIARLKDELAATKTNPIVK